MLHSVAEVVGMSNPFTETLIWLMTETGISWEHASSRVCITRRPEHLSSVRTWSPEVIQLLSTGFQVPVGQIKDKLRELGAEEVRLFRRPVQGSEVYAPPWRNMESTHDVRREEEQEWKARSHRLGRLLEEGGD